MKIGELAKRAGTSTRMLRYYETQGLLTAKRSANGYRSYAETDVERARTIVSLIQSGLPSKLIQVVLTAQDQPESWGDTCDLEFAKLLRAELDTIDTKISCLTRSRAAVETYLERSAVDNVMVGNS
ncbi:MerR family transcriptional regulator [Leucobacter celer]|uniref:MerR family transcriptional regulator n=1 Tax=Leucobacter celer TaxID=668625 RepID=UPI0006A7F1AA|nr:MerR family transcriptional regulator [Leucobacter celer]